MGAYGSNMEFDSSFHMWESTGIAEQEHLDCSPGIQFLDDSFDYFLFCFILLFFVSSSQVSHLLQDWEYLKLQCLFLEHLVKSKTHIFIYLI